MANANTSKDPFRKAKLLKKYMKILVYSDSGVGKTHFALTWPNLAVIDTEGGTDWFADRFDFSVLDTKSFSEILEAVKFLEQGKHHYQTLSVDPVTVVWHALQDGRLEFKSGKDMERAVTGFDNSRFSYDDWGQLKRFYGLLMTKLINLPMHVILICRESDEYEVRGKELVKLGIKPDAEKSTKYFIDIRFRMVWKNDIRYGIIEKDRTGYFAVGTSIERPGYDSFRPIIERINNGSELAIHQDDEEARIKDRVFFQQKGKDETAVTAAPGRSSTVPLAEASNTPAPSSNAPTEAKSETAILPSSTDEASQAGSTAKPSATDKSENNHKKGKNLLDRLNRLGLKDFHEQYKLYVQEKYSQDGRLVKSLDDLAEDELAAQETILDSCKAKYARLKEFKAILEGKNGSTPGQNGHGRESSHSSTPDQKPSEPSTQPAADPATQPPLESKQESTSVNQPNHETKPASTPAVLPTSLPNPESMPVNQPAEFNYF